MVGYFDSGSAHHRKSPVLCSYILGSILSGNAAAVLLFLLALITQIGGRPIFGRDLDILSPRVSGAIGTPMPCVRPFFPNVDDHRVASKVLLEL